MVLVTFAERYGKEGEIENPERNHHDAEDEPYLGSDASSIEKASASVGVRVCSDGIKAFIRLTFA